MSRHCGAKLESLMRFAMKRNTHPARLITTPDEEDRRKFNAFAARVKKQKLDKVEKILAISSPSDEFRDWLTKILWRLDRGNQPGAHVRSVERLSKRNCGIRLGLQKGFGHQQRLFGRPVTHR
jgi:hypothetical protein